MNRNILFACAASLLLVSCSSAFGMQQKKKLVTISITNEGMHVGFVKQVEEKFSDDGYFLSYSFKNVVADEEFINEIITGGEIINKKYELVDVKDKITRIVVKGGELNEHLVSFICSCKNLKELVLKNLILSKETALKLLGSCKLRLLDVSDSVEFKTKLSMSAGVWQYGSYQNIVKSFFKDYVKSGGMSVIEQDFES